MTEFETQAIALLTEIRDLLKPKPLVLPPTATPMRVGAADPPLRPRAQPTRSSS